MAGEIGQCDFWFPDVQVPVGYGQVRTATALPVLTMVCGYSRWASGLLIPTRAAEDLYAGWWQHISVLGATPRVFVWDGEGAVGRWRARREELTAACQGFRGTLGAKVVICKPGDPEAKGLVERFHDYLEGARVLIGDFKPAWSSATSRGTTTTDTATRPWATGPRPSTLPSASAATPRWPAASTETGSHQPDSRTGWAPADHGESHPASINATANCEEPVIQLGTRTRLPPRPCFLDFAAASLETRRGSPSPCSPNCKAAPRTATRVIDWERHGPHLITEVIPP